MTATSTVEMDTISRLLGIEFAKGVQVEISSSLQNPPFVLMTIDYEYREGIAPDEEDNLVGRIEWVPQSKVEDPVIVTFVSNSDGTNVNFAGLPPSVNYPFVSSQDAQRILGTVNEETFKLFLESLVAQAVAAQ